jgi:hypothetical protein
MVEMALPNTYTEINETGCCAVPSINDWDKKVVHFDAVHFIRANTWSVFFAPMNMAKVMTSLQRSAEAAGAAVPPQREMTLSHDLSPWRAEHLYAVSEPVDGADNVVVSGDFASCVFEGAYSHAKQWRDETVAYAAELGRVPRDVYFFYTTCPKCAKAYRKNYVIVLASLEPAFQ